MLQSIIKAYSPVWQINRLLESLFFWLLWCICISNTEQRQAHCSKVKKNKDLYNTSGFLHFKTETSCFKSCISRTMSSSLWLVVASCELSNNPFTLSKQLKTSSSFASISLLKEVYLTQTIKSVTYLIKSVSRSFSLAVSA